MADARAGLTPDAGGAYAEYALADESQVGLKPANLSHSEAAALPLVSLTGLQALKKAGAPWEATILYRSASCKYLCAI